MKSILYLLITLVAISWSSFAEDDGPLILPELDAEVDKREALPRFKLVVLGEDRYRIDGIEFNKDQLGVIFAVLGKQEQKPAVELSGSQDVLFKHVREVSRLGLKHGLDEFIFSVPDLGGEVKGKPEESKEEEADEKPAADIVKIEVIDEAESDLKVLHTAVSNYLADNDGVWPQIPEAILVDGEIKDVAEWWFETFEPYGAKREHWHHSEDPNPDKFSYIPAGFDANKNTAYKWARQPWFMQRTKGKTGTWMVLPDGSLNELEAALELQK